MIPGITNKSIKYLMMKKLKLSSFDYVKLYMFAPGFIAETNDDGM